MISAAEERRIAEAVEEAARPLVMLALVYLVAHPATPYQQLPRGDSR